MKRTKFLAVCALQIALGMSGSLMAQNMHGYDRSNMDTKVKPGTDFVKYATGKWLENHPLRDDQLSNGAFMDLYELNQKRIQEIILEYATKPQAQGTLGQKIGSLYNLKMDTIRRDREGYTPIIPALNKIRNVKDVHEYQRVCAELDRRGENTMMWGCGVGADQKQADMNLVGIGQGGLGLGQRDYYLDEDESTVAIREAYKKYMTKLFTLVGYSEAEAKQKTEAVYAIELRIAKASYSNVQLRDVEANYHKMSYAQLLKDFPGIDWTTCFWVIGFPSFDWVDVGQPEPIHEMEKVLAETKLEDLKSYAEIRVISGNCGNLSSDFQKAAFEFASSRTGKAADDPMWKKATALVDNVLSDAIGQMYCEKYFPESSKERMTTMVRNLQVALGQRIQEATWMSDTTKVMALDKLSNFVVKIGYPDKWKNYDNIIVDENLSLYENLANISEQMLLDELRRKVGKPVDRTEWLMSPQTINAYYMPSTNEICFPAAILQAPFFDPEADDAINYGAIGAVIGHEMSHGFDDQGCQFDKTGNQNNWWTATDKANFDKRAQVLVETFGKYPVVNGKCVNGELTLGENIGDNGGLNVALRAMHNQGINNTIDGFTADQRFFLAWARVWAGNEREQYMEMLLTMDVHSPNTARVNVALPQIDEWYTAFNVKKNDKLYIAPKKRARIW